MTTSWKPTRKWMANLITALVGVGTMYFTTGSWDAEESIAMLSVIGTASAIYLVPDKAQS